MHVRIELPARVMAESSPNNVARYPLALLSQLPHPGFSVFLQLDEGLPDGPFMEP